MPDTKDKRPRLTKEEESIVIKINELKGEFWDFANKIYAASEGATEESPIMLEHHKDYAFTDETDWTKSSERALLHFIAYQLAKKSVKKG